MVIVTVVACWIWSAVKNFSSFKLHKMCTTPMGGGGGGGGKESLSI